MSLHLVDNDGNLQSEGKIVDFIGSVVPKSGKRAAHLGGEELLREIGVNYHVVGVFGGQSSGKSTLLNHVFGTDFQTLDETVRRGQTTKGAFLSKANSALEGFKEEATADVRAPLLVVDFEGTDGLERGEDQSFERQLSLFGLSMADTLIINMWAVDVGRFNAANLSLLRTIFEVNLQLFSHDSYEKDEKPTLLIILRDFTEDDAKPSLTTVRKSFDMIWDNISRPAEFADATIDALFNLKYYTMPHYRLQRKEFDESVVTLRHWFGDARHKEYLFRHRAMFRGVPLEGLPQYMMSCWHAILSSKDLDIPTQREMLAQHRCKEAKLQELRNYQTFTRQYEERISRGELLVRLSEVLDEEMERRLQEFARQTKLYNPEVVAQYAQDLERELLDATMRVVGRLSAAVAAEVIAGLDVRLQTSIDGCINSLLKAAQGLPFPAFPMGGGGASHHNDQDDDDAYGGGSFHTSGLGSGSPLGAGGGGAGGAAAGYQVTRYYVDSPQCQQLVLRFWKTLRTDLNSLLNEMVVDPPPVNLYGRYASLMAQDKTARGNVMNTVTEAVFKKVSGRLSAMSESAADSIHRGYETCLAHSTDGTVKFFATTAGLQQAVPPAQQAGLVFLGCLLYFRLRLAPAYPELDEEAEEGASATKPSGSRSARRIARDRKRVSVRQEPCEKNFFLSYTTLDSAPRYPSEVPIAAAPVEGEEPEPGVSAECVLLTQPQVQRAYDTYRQKCDFTTQMQLRSIESSRQQLPAWVIPALLILGFNKIWYVVTNPPLLILIGIIAFVFFKNYILTQWQIFEETGPSAIVLPAQAFLRTVKDLYQQNIEPHVQQLQDYQQQQQETLRRQHRTSSQPQRGGGFSRTSPVPEEHAAAAGGGRRSRHGPASSSSSAAPSPHNAADAAARPRTVPKRHADPAQGDSKPQLPRRRSAHKEH